MPSYDYECKACGHRFEVFQNMSDPPLKKCPKCGKSVRRLIGGGLGVIFKGSGFYVTDNKKGAEASSAKKSKDADTKTAAAGPAKTENSPAAAEKKETKPAAKDSA